MVQDLHKSKKLIYYYYGAQCYGYKYMACEAEKAAKVLNYQYEKIDISIENASINTPLYFPGNIVVDDLVITYPGSAKEIVQAIRHKGVIAGQLEYNQLKRESAHYFKPLLGCLKACSKICLKKQANDVSEKYNWINKQAKYTNEKAGLVAFYNNKPVAAVEFVREDRVPYSIPNHRKQFLFITCLYNDYYTNKDFRDSLLTELKNVVIKDKLAGISVICGKDTPYPNGPVQILLDNGFVVNKKLDRVLLKNKWEQIFYMQWFNKALYSI
ncbi:hypothetical protein IMX26_04640 [Clostridium sp. 'deep sea']|uniref:hypothetical protein n=1 Tax=Clostridium sp. 'deep sea' TaxID=2779445 RepID=UPI0018969A24|nr:hypothetical protein [Clostridium sp. 'deep sea']QOR36107.1 hypothetical protein IMX26_04640 [Clostridium sp. 'deep sea']